MIMIGRCLSRVCSWFPHVFQACIVKYAPIEPCAPVSVHQEYTNGPLCDSVCFSNMYRQHISVSTHSRGHTLDVITTPTEYRFAYPKPLYIQSRLSDHSLLSSCFDRQIVSSTRDVVVKRRCLTNLNLDAFTRTFLPPTSSI